MRLSVIRIIIITNVSAPAIQPTGSMCQGNSGVHTVQTIFFLQLGCKLNKCSVVFSSVRSFRVLYGIYGTLKCTPIEPYDKEDLQVSLENALSECSILS